MHLNVDFLTFLGGDKPLSASSMSVLKKYNRTHNPSKWAIKNQEDLDKYQKYKK